MNLFDITSLQRDTKQSNLYDLTEPTFVLKELGIYSMTVLPEQTMRPDLISYSIYQSVNYVDLILDLNSIDNPLNIKSGDIIYYISLDQLDYYRQNPNIVTQQRNILLNANKSTKIDNNRQIYTDNNYQLSPTFLQNPGSPISISGGNITISPRQ
jgi:hypothetical protein